MQPEFVRPPLPARVLEKIESEEMARLQSRPKSSKKPQLISYLPTDDSKSEGLRGKNGTPSIDRRRDGLDEHFQGRIRYSCIQQY